MTAALSIEAGLQAVRAWLAASTAIPLARILAAPTTATALASPYLVVRVSAMTPEAVPAFDASGDDTEAQRMLVTLDVQALGDGAREVAAAIATRWRGRSEASRALREAGVAPRAVASMLDVSQLDRTRLLPRVDVALTYSQVTVATTGEELPHAETIRLVTEGRRGATIVAGGEIVIPTEEPA